MLANSEKVDPRSIRTRRLLDAFIDLMEEKLFEDITVQDITVHATVNRATFYAHFPDKYAIVEDGLCEVFTRALQNHAKMPLPPHSYCCNRFF